MRILVAVKRVVDYNVKVHVLPDHSDVDFGMALNGAAGTPSPVTIAEADDVSATQVPSRLEAGRILTVKIPLQKVSSTLSNRIPETKENSK